MPEAKTDPGMMTQTEHHKFTAKELDELRRLGDDPDKEIDGELSEPEINLVLLKRQRPDVHRLELRIQALYLVYSRG